MTSGGERVALNQERITHSIMEKIKRIIKRRRIFRTRVGHVNGNKFSSRQNKASFILNVGCFRGADCNSHNCLLVEMFWGCCR
jgi:hypothetical protein